MGRTRSFFPAFRITLTTIFFTLTNLVGATPVVEWDFAKGTLGWTGNQRVTDLSSSAEGIIFQCTGLDPWIEGPAVDLPSDKIFRISIRMKSNADPGAQLFYGHVFTEGMSKRFGVKTDNKWHDYSFFIRDKLGKDTRFRLDPCTAAGTVSIVFISIEALTKIEEPILKKPKLPDDITVEKLTSKSGQLEVLHYGKCWGNFAVNIDNIRYAVGYGDELIGFVTDDKTHWLSLADADVSFKQNGPQGFTAIAKIKDPTGGTWTITRAFRKNACSETIDVISKVTVDKDRQVVRLPWLTIFPGLGNFGPKKHQALFAGLDYLADEPSSTKADIETAEHLRRIPDPVKITFPLMAIETEGKYLGLIWGKSDMTAAAFDSPDRLYNSGAHLMELSAPAVGDFRLENDYAAMGGFTMTANKPITAKAMIIAGTGDSVVQAVKHYLQLNPIPPLPTYKNGFADAAKLLSLGWLDSDINQDGLIRHAVWGNSFGPTPAADAAALMNCHAAQTEDKNLRERLLQGSKQILSKLPPNDPYSSGVSHVRPPIAPLIFGRVTEYVQLRKQQAQNLLNQFDENGVKLYHPGKVDYSRTHFAKHANGLAAGSVVQILEAATLCADKQLIEKAIELLDKQTILYANTVPRGAQTWEVPLHTPDVLASAHLVKAYLLGYIITDRTDLLKEAQYWAWTGLPFVYLENPTENQVGPYATIAVYGATSWQAPVWFGMPVQWCGLVYGSSLYDLAEYDPKGPWLQIAKGITITALQMTWPESDKERVGLLPDIYHLQDQRSDGPAINPGTVGTDLARAYDRGKIYDVKKIRSTGWFVHAPGAIRNIKTEGDTVTLDVHASGNLLISGVQNRPAQISTRPIGSSAEFQHAPIQYDEKLKCLVIILATPSNVSIKTASSLLESYSIDEFSLPGHDILLTVRLPGNRTIS